MAENQPRQSSSSADRCASPQNQSIPIRKSARLRPFLRPSLQQQDSSSAPSTSTALRSPTPEELDPSVAAVASTSKEVSSANKHRKAAKSWDPAMENLFFEALKLFGKDYDAIGKYVAQKFKAPNDRSLPQVRDQIRHYYHNTSSKLLTLLASSIADLDVPKEIKELFALINYGEWKKKTQMGLVQISKENYLKPFKVMVMNGSASMKHGNRTKIAGKKKRTNWIVRTPNCPALRRLVEGKDNFPVDTSVPKNIMIELSPSNQSDRAYVLGCWQNPNMRFELNMNQPINDWIRYLQNKWIPQDLRMRKTLVGEDISNELPGVSLHPASCMPFRLVTLNPVGTKMSSSSAPSNGFASSLGFGLRKYANIQSESGQAEQAAPASPGKSDRKRRKSTSAANETDQPSEQIKSKRSRPDLMSPPPDDVASGMVRGVSDGGESESSCEAFTKQPEANAEAQGDLSGGSPEEQRPSADEMQNVLSPEGNVADEKLEVVVTKDGAKSQPQFPHMVTLNPDVIRNGLNLETCASLTVGHLCLMCDKAQIIRLKYTVTPKVSNGVVNAVDSWNFFVQLVRANFLDTAGRKFLPLINRVISPPICAAPSSVVRQQSAEASTSSSSESAGSITIQLMDHSVVDQQHHQRPTSTSSIVKEVFAAPRPVAQMGTKPTIHRALSMTETPPIMTRGTNLMANQSNAFLQQMGQIIKKPVVVNKKRAFVSNKTSLAYKVPLVPLSSTRTKHMVSSNQGTIIVIPQSFNRTSVSSMESSSRVTSSIGINEMSAESPQLIQSQMSTDSLFASSSGFSSQARTMVAPPESGSTLNTPDVSLMRTSPEPVADSGITAGAAFDQQQQQIARVQVLQTIPEVANETPCDASAAPGAPPQPAVQVPSLPAQDLITSDSFLLDFSLGSFPATGGATKQLESPKRSQEKESVGVLNVIHSLRMDTDDSALSSPPRPIRPGAMVRNDGKSSYQLGGMSNSNQFPSTSNLFPMLDGTVDNESSNTRNFFAACAMSSVLDTPEKCKDDDRR